MRNGLFYLNNSGSRWVVLEDGKREKIFAYVNGELIQRTVIFFESFGNFACACISFKGKRHKILNFSYDADNLSKDVHNNKIE